jgi:hypothetical protein
MSGLGEHETVMASVASVMVSVTGTEVAALTFASALTVAVIA